MKCIVLVLGPEVRGEGDVVVRPVPSAALGEDPSASVWLLGCPCAPRHSSACGPVALTPSSRCPSSAASVGPIPSARTRSPWTRAASMAPSALSHLQRRYFQIRSHSRVLGFRVPTWGVTLPPPPLPEDGGCLKAGGGPGSPPHRPSLVLPLARSACIWKTQ